jgi:hypothetical protein
MSIFDDILKNMPGGPKSVCKHILTNYNDLVAQHPKSSRKEIFKMILDKRYQVTQFMSQQEINEIIKDAETMPLPILATCVMMKENPAAFSERYSSMTHSEINNFGSTGISVVK